LRTALVFGYGQNADGNIDEQTRDRCMKAAELYRSNQVWNIYLTVSASKNGHSMAEKMAEYLVANGVRRESIVIDRRGGNTAGELDVFLSILQFGCGELVLVSTWYHLPRIAWLALWRLGIDQFSLRVAWNHAHFKGDVLVEFLKLTNAILRPRKSSKKFNNAPAIT